MNSIQINYYENIKIIKSIWVKIIQKKTKKIIIEKYIYDTKDRIVEIKREHKDKRTFYDENYFPENIYKSLFKIEYNGNEVVHNKILWNEKMVYNKK